MTCSRGRCRHVETPGPFCPHAACSDHGRRGWGNSRANGHPNGRRWRQRGCRSCKRHFLEAHGTLLHGKHVAPDQRAWAMAALAEGRGIRAVARVCETDPNTVLGWLGEAAEPLAAFSRHFLRDRVTCYRHRRLVGVTHRVSFGPAATVESTLAKRGWKITTCAPQLLDRLAISGSASGLPR